MLAAAAAAKRLPGRPTRPGAPASSSPTTNCSYCLLTYYSRFAVGGGGGKGRRAGRSRDRGSRTDARSVRQLSGPPKEGRHHSRRRFPTPTGPPTRRVPLLRARRGGEEGRRSPQHVEVLVSVCCRANPVHPPPAHLVSQWVPCEGRQAPPHHPDYKFRRRASAAVADSRTGLLQAVTTRLSSSGASDYFPAQHARRCRLPACTRLYYSGGGRRLLATYLLAAR